MFPAMTTRAQEDFGEISALQWLTGRGAKVALPVGHSPDWDLIAELGRGLVRVQVKTSTFRRNGRWEIVLCTRGGHRSWSGVVKCSTRRAATTCSSTSRMGGAGSF